MLKIQNQQERARGWHCNKELDLSDVNTGTDLCANVSCQNKVKDEATLDGFPATLNAQAFSAFRPLCYVFPVIRKSAAILAQWIKKPNHPSDFSLNSSAELLPKKDKYAKMKFVTSSSQNC